MNQHIVNYILSWNFATFLNSVYELQVMYCELGVFVVLIEQLLLL